MGVSLIRTNSLVAFVSTVIAIALYLIVFLMLVYFKDEHAMFPTIAGYLGFV